MKFSAVLNKIKGLNFDYKKYWDSRYRNMDNSGSGSYGKLAEYKAEFINNLIQEKGIKSVIEFGCGDGNQISLLKCPSYLGLDVAASSIEICTGKYSNDNSKNFILYDPAHFYNTGYIKADLVLSLDVLYHIIPEDDFAKSLKDIFSTAERFVLLYTNIDSYKSTVYKKGDHVRHRDIYPYLKEFTNFVITKTVPPPWPELSSASFILLEKKS